MQALWAVAMNRTPLTQPPPCNAPSVTRVLSSSPSNFLCQVASLKHSLSPTARGSCHSLASNGYISRREKVFCSYRLFSAVGDERRGGAALALESDSEATATSSSTELLRRPLVVESDNGKKKVEGEGSILVKLDTEGIVLTQGDESRADSAFIAPHTDSSSPPLKQSDQSPSSVGGLRGARGVQILRHSDRFEILPTADKEVGGLRGETNAVVVVGRTTEIFNPRNDPVAAMPRVVPVGSHGQLKTRWIWRGQGSEEREADDDGRRKITADTEALKMGGGVQEISGRVRRSMEAESSGKVEEGEGDGERPRKGVERSVPPPGYGGSGVNSLWRAGVKKVEVVLEASEGKMERGQGLEMASEVKKVVVEILAHGGDDVGAVIRPMLEKYTGSESMAWDQVMKELERRGGRKQALMVFQVLQTAVEDEAGVEGRAPILTETCVSAIIGILGRGGKMGRAQEIFDGVPATWRNVYVYSALITGYVRQGLMKEAWELMERMRLEGVQPNVVTYNVMISGCAKQRKGVWPRRALELFERMQAEGHMMIAAPYAATANACAHMGDVDRAASILRQMKDAGFQPDVVTYTILIDEYGKAGRIDDAMRVCERMRSEGVHPNVYTYNALIRAYSRAGSVDVAASIFEGMRDAGCDPSVWTYNHMINMYSREGLHDAAESMLEDMRRQGLSPDRVTYNMLLDSYSKAKLYGKARSTLEAMHRGGCRPDLYTFNILLDCCGKDGRLEEAQKILKELKGAGLKPNLITYSTLISAYGREGWYEDAIELFREMTSAGCIPNALTFCGLIDAFAYHGKYEEAEKIFVEMQKKGVEPEVRSYTAVMDAFARGGRPDDVIRIFDEMQDAGYVPDAVTHAIVARALIKSGREDEAFPYFDRVIESGVESRLCTDLVQNYGAFMIGCGYVPPAKRISD